MPILICLVWKATDSLPFWTCTQSLFMERKWKMINFNDGHWVRAGDKMSLSHKLLYLFNAPSSLVFRISVSISKRINAKSPTSFPLLIMPFLYFLCLLATTTSSAGETDVNGLHIQHSFASARTPGLLCPVGTKKKASECLFLCNSCVEVPEALLFPCNLWKEYLFFFFYKRKVISGDGRNHISPPPVQKIMFF